MHVQRSNLAIPVLDRPLSTSLLDSDPSVSRRYSSDIPSRRPSALDEAYSKCLQPDSRPEGVPQSLLQTLNRPDEEQTVNGNYSSTIITTTTTTTSSSSPYHLAPTTTTTAPSTHEETIVVITQGYLMPRSPCVSSDNNSLFQFPPRIVDGVHYRIDRSSSYGGNATGSCHSLDKGDEQTDRVAVEYLPGIPGKTPFSFRRKSCGDKAHHSFLALKAGLNSCALQNKQNLTTTAEVSTLLENEDENCPPVGPDHPAPTLSLDVHNHDVSTNTTNEEIPSVVDLLSAADQDSPLAETDSADSRNSPEERAPQSIPSSAAIASAGPVSHSNLSPKYDSLELPLGHLERPKTLAAHSSPQRAVSHETLSLPFSPSRTLSSFPKMSRVNETFSFSLSSAGPTTKPSSPIVKISTSSLSPMTNTTTATSATPNSPTIKRSTTSLSPMDNTTSTTSRSHSLTPPVDRPSSLLSPLFQRSPSLTPTSGGGHSNNAAPSLGHRSLSVRSVPAATATATAATTAASSVRGSSSSNTLLVPSPLPSRRPDSSASSKSSPLPPLSLTPLPPLSPLTPRLPCVLD
ncbi:mucin-5AC [Aplysia californica]|uniref:Mucin-5AC n=1 Tax=Aplysia californica TaxID=6500 RepID=A0ABM1AD18_APLCA|nr:mucin-5AC [Aplysia californica]